MLIFKNIFFGIALSGVSHAQSLKHRPTSNSLPHAKATSTFDDVDD